MKKAARLATLAMAMMVSISFIVFLSCKKNEPSQQNARLQEVTDSLRTALGTQLNLTVPSMSILIQTPKETWFTCSAAPGEQVITPETYFRFASNTKNFTAAAILNMHEDGWMDYRAKITDTIPGSKIPYVPVSGEWNIPNKSIITIEQLLQHSAGVYDVDNDSVPGLGGLSYVSYMLNQDPNHQFTSSELVNQVVLHNLRYTFEPGKGHHYSNTGYTILGEIIARVYSFRAGSDKTCSDYLYDHIFGPSTQVPLQIHFPDLATDQTLPEPYCCGTIMNPGPGEFGTNCQNNMSAHVAEGNGYGTMRELNKYIRTMMKGENVLEPSTVEIMKHTTPINIPGYALGTIHVTNLGYGHNGAIFGYLSYMLYDPQHDVSLITMMPFWDLTRSDTSFFVCLNAVQQLGSVGRKALGYPGMP